jgi:uncharacterized membrane-anchored protein
MAQPHGRHLRARSPGAKVPVVGALFWIIKLVTTGVGEATGDYLAHLSIALAAAIGCCGLLTTLWRQLRADHYRAPTYWSAVLAVAVFGTMAADGLHIVFKVPYVASTVLFAVAVAVIFWWWWSVEHTLSIHSIARGRREAFYWLAVLGTFALGTAAGDLTATSLGLGFAASAVLFAALMCLPALGWWRFGLNPVLAFWWAYVLTRPLGASLADWLGKPHSTGNGLGYGDGTVSLIGLALFLVLVGALVWTRADAQAPDPTDQWQRAAKVRNARIR